VRSSRRWTVPKWPTLNWSAWPVTLLTGLNRSSRFMIGKANWAVP